MASSIVGGSHGHGNDGGRRTRSLNSEENNQVVTSYHGVNEFEEHQRYQPKRSPAIIWWTQFQALMRKNFQVLKRQWKSTSYFIIGPSLFLIGLILLSSAIKTANDESASRYTTSQLVFDKCQSYDIYGNVYPRVDHPCISIIYAPNTSDTYAIMEDVRAQIPWATTYDIQAFDSVPIMIDWMYDHMGLADHMINFNRTLYYQPPTPHRATYEIWRNASGDAVRTSALQAIVDLAIIKKWKQQAMTEQAEFQRNQRRSMFDDAINNEEQAAADVASATGTKGPIPSGMVQVEYQLIPAIIPNNPSSNKAFNTDDRNMVVSIGLCLALVVSIAVGALLVIQTITTEKKEKLLGRMRIMGLNESAYWITWFLTYLSIAVFISLIIPAIGQATDFGVYQRAPYSVHVLLTFMLCVSITALALCISSCVQKPAWVNVASILFFFAATFTSVFPLAEQQNIWYSPDMTNILLFIYWCMPWFHFNKSMGDIMRATQSRVIGNKGDGTSAGNQTRIYPSFAFDQIYDTQWYSTQCEPAPMCCTTENEYLCFTAPSISYAMQMQLCVAILYFVLAWYFSQLGGDLGASQPFYFPISPTYWGFGKKKTREGLVEGDTLSREQIQSREQKSVRTYKISKAFKDQSAVKEVSLQMDRGECFVLLGHNGAGKTTMINMLTGLIPPTYGEAFVFGMDIRNDTTQIQQTMGICPQEDWLWPQLTSFEHLLLFAALRGLPRNIWPQAIAAKLAEFHLGDLINTPTAKLSGGMKRRLSLAMATLGAPEIIFLDEPTTGMDPVNKHKVWNAIANLKRDRVIVLTTHSMEEADFLGDKVAMMSGGRLRAMGTSLYLKNHFGAGYQIHLLSSPSNIPQLEQVVKDILPSAEIVGNAGGNLTVALPRKAVRMIPDFFRWIDQAKKSAENGILVKEWSISNSTLEEVFLRLCSSEKGVNEVTVDFSKQKDNNGNSGDGGEEKKRMCLLCHEREAQLVTMLTQTGVRVTVPNVICMYCCMGAAFMEEEKRQQEIEDGGMFGGTDPSNNTTATTTAATPAIGIAAITHVPSDPSSPSPATATTTVAVVPPSPSPSSPIATPEKNDNNNNNGNNNNGVPEYGRGLKDAVGARPPTARQQIRAIFFKNMALSLAERKTWLFRLALLITFAFLLGTDSGGKLDPKQWCVNNGGYKNNPFTGFPCNRTDFMNIWMNNRYINTYPPRYYSTSGLIWDRYDPVRGWLQKEVPTYGSENAYWGNYVYYQDSTVPGDAPLDSWDMVNQGIGNNKRSVTGTFVNRTSVNMMAEWTEHGTWVHGNATISPNLNCQRQQNGARWYLNTNTGTQQETWDFVRALFGDSYLVMKRSDPANLTMSYHVKIWDTDYWSGSYGPTGIFTNGTRDNWCWSPSPALRDATQGLPMMINGMSNALAWTALYQYEPEPKVKLHWNDTFIGASIIRYEASQWQPVVTVETIAKGLASLSFITMLLWPTYVYRIIYEREERLFHMMRISGMKTNTYWIANYSFDLMMQIVWSMIFLIIPTAFGAQVIVRPGVAIHAVVLICFAHALMGMTVFFSALFTSRRAAAVVGYLIVIVTSGLAPILSTQMKTWPLIIFILPPVAYIRALDLGLRYGSSAFESNGDMATSLIMLAVMGTVWLFVGIYLNTIKYRSSLYVFDSCRPAKRRSYQRAQQEAAAARGDGAAALLYDENGGDDGDDDSGDEVKQPIAADGDMVMKSKYGYGSLTPEQLAKEDIDVRAERQRIMTAPWSKGGTAPAIVIRNLVKSFTKSGTEKNDKLAVNHICLGIDQGECFGLLGPNGAGKTTTLSILSGLLDQTRGTVRVGAYDTRTEIDLVYTILGICPQFDTVWEDLSIRDHFLFYARLKGATPEYEAALAQQQAEMVDLDGDAFNKNAASLSGGMKRRLSIGISLIGNPKVWLLDEPSTGLSPEARRQVWDIVSKQRKVGRTVIITTHSMEEADTLCSRIGIVAKGQLKCLGTQSHLKARFGDGFKLVFNLDHITTRRIDGAPLAIEADSKDVARDAELDSYVVNDLTCRGAVLTGAVGKNMVYTLPKDGATTEDVLRIFNAMERKQKELKARFGVVEWGVQQSSLEEVFISVVDQADRDEDAAASGIEGITGDKNDAQRPLIAAQKAQVDLAEITRLTKVCC